LPSTLTYSQKVGSTAQRKTARLCGNILFLLFAETEIRQYFDRFAKSCHFRCFLKAGHDSLQFVKDCFLGKHFVRFRGFLGKKAFYFHFLEKSPFKYGDDSFAARVVEEVIEKRDCFKVLPK